MKILVLSRACLVAFAVGIAILASGCTPTPSTTTTSSTSSSEHKHDGWWCVEHGVPEEECAQCDKTLVAKFKAAGDWCKEHNRPESQCFICNPKRFDTFAARYEAKYGEKPTMPTE